MREQSRQRSFFDYTFDERAMLSKSNPELFEELSKQAIQGAIRNAAPRLRPGLIALQAKINRGEFG